MSQNAIKIIDRLKEELSINTDKNLCKLIDIKPNTLSTWKKRDSLDFNKVIELCEKRNLDLNYIFFDEKDIKIEKKGTIEATNILKPDKSSEKKPEAILFKKLQLVNTNRNIALFNSIFSYHPALEGNNVVVGQKIRKKQIVKDVLYIIELETKELLIDELQELQPGNKEMGYKLKNYHPFDYAINPEKHVKHVWQYIDSIEDIAIK